MHERLIYIIMVSLSICLISVNSFAEDFTQWNLPEGATTRLGKGKINEITFSPDGTKFAVATIFAVWIYSADNGKELALLNGHKSTVESIVFTSDGQSLMSADSSGETRVWNVSTGEQLSILTQGNDLVEKVALSEDCTELVTISKDDKFRIWDLRNPKADPLVINDTPRSVNFLEFSTDAEIIAVTKAPLHSQDGKAVENVRLQVWNIDTKNLLMNIPGESPFITALKLLPDGNTIVTVDEDKQIQFWNIKTGTTSLTYEDEESVSVTLAYAPKNRILATGMLNIKLWNISPDGKKSSLNRTLKGHEHRVIASAFSPDENTLLTASDDGVIIAWDLTTGKQLFNISGHLGITLRLAYSDSSNTILSANQRASSWIAWDTQIHHWDLITNRIISTEKIEFGRIHQISPDCRTVVVSKANGDIEFLDIESKERQYTLNGFDKDKIFRGVTFSSDKQTIATNGLEGKLYVWKISDLDRTSKPWKTLSLTTEQGWMKSLSADGSMLASVERNKIVRLWNVKTGENYLTFYDDIMFSSDDGKRISGLAFSPDGKVIVIGNEEEIHLWNTKTGEQIAICIPDRITARMTFIFSPDSRILVNACGDTIHRFEDGEIKTADGSYIIGFISEYETGTFQLWDTRTGELLSTHDGHTNKIVTFAFSNDGKTLASGSWDGTILLWDWEKLKSMR